jgi:outer membrane protein OmpA-like peptidoglycan-associated protein
MTQRHNLWMLPALVFASLPACTAEKTAMMKGEDTPAVAETSTTATPPPLSIAGYAATDHLQVIYFDLNRSKLNDDAQSKIQKNAEWLKQNPPFLVKVVGLSDTRGSDKHNKTLAERRAMHVRDAYAAQGIPKERITILGLGSETSTCTEPSETCLSQSRRAETLVESKAIASK